MDFLETVKPLAFRAKLALPLVYAEHVIWRFSFTAEHAAALRLGLETAWRWIADQSVTALEIYETIYPMLRLTEGPQEDRKRLEGICSVISAVYYVAWRAESYDFTHQGIDNRKLFGGDFFDVTAQIALDAKNQAIRAAKHPKSEFAWQQEQLQSFLERYRTDQPGTLGPLVPRALPFEPRVWEMPNQQFLVATQAHPIQFNAADIVVPGFPGLEHSHEFSVLDRDRQVIRVFGHHLDCSLEDFFYVTDIYRVLSNQLVGINYEQQYGRDSITKTEVVIDQLRELNLGADELQPLLSRVP
jgi:hypothetical protein